MSALKPGSSLTPSTPLPTQQQLQQQQSQQAVQQRAPGQTPGLRYPSNRKTIYDRNLSRSKNAELSRAAFAFLFVEMIGYAQRRVTGIADLEKRWVFGACSLLSNSRGGQVGERTGLEGRGIGNQGSRLRKLGVEIQIQTQTQHGTNATANAPPEPPG